MACCVKKILNSPYFGLNFLLHEPMSRRHERGESRWEIGARGSHHRTLEHPGLYYVDMQGVRLFMTSATRFFLIG